MSQTKVNVLIICALKDEYDSLLKIQNDYNSEWKLSTLVKEYIASEARLQTVNGKEIIVLATWLSQMGREAAQSISTKLIHELQPNFIAMSGICAGYRGKVSLGDVIFADRLWSYDSGKIIVEGDRRIFKADPLPYVPSLTLVQYMQSIESIIQKEEHEWINQRPHYSLEYQENWVLRELYNDSISFESEEFDQFCPNWSNVFERLLKKEFIEEPLEPSKVRLTQKGHDYISKVLVRNPKRLPEDNTFKIHVAPILTGAQVQEDENLFNSLSENCRKVLGIDMEASGIGSISEIYKIPSVVVKGVSDYGDTFKDDRYREFAAYAAAYALITYLRHYYDKIIDVGISTNSTQTEISNIQKHSDMSDDEILSELTEIYETNADISMLWERAGGKKSTLEMRSRAKDSWFILWSNLKKGTKVTIKDLLSVVSQEYPENPKIRNYLKNF